MTQANMPSVDPVASPHLDMRPDVRSEIRDAAAALRRHLVAVAARAKWITAVDSLAWSFIAAAVFLAFVAWMDMIWQLPFGFRQWVLPLVLVSLAVGVIVTLVRRFRVLNTQRIARRLDSLSGSGGQILSGWELVEPTVSNQSTVSNQTQNSPQSALSRGIASVAIDQAATRAVAVPSHQAAPWSIAKRGGLAMLMVGIVAVVIALLAPHALATSWKRLVIPDLSTPPYSPLVFDVSPGDTQCNYGSPLEVTADISGGAVDEADLVLGRPDDPAATRVAMFPRGGGTWQAVVPRLTQSSDYFVSAGRGRSETYRVEVMQVPTIQSISFTITPPAYTGVPARKGRYPQDRIAGLATTQVTLHVEADRPLSGGTVALQSSDPMNANLSDSNSVSMVSLQTDPEKDQLVTGTVTITDSAKWTVSVRGSNSIETESPITLDITLLADRMPIVKIVQPPAKSFATPDTTVPVGIVAEDDFGIDRLQLYRMIDGSPPSPLEFTLSSGDSGLPKARRIVQQTSRLQFAKLGLQPGDKISLFARAEDNRPDVVQAGESAIHEIEIISQSDFDRIIAARQGKQMLENKYRQANRMLEQLASAMEDLQEELKNADPDDAEKQAELQEKLEQLKQKMKDVADELEKLAEKELPLDLDKEWNKVLKEQADALRAACEAAGQSKKDGKSPQEQADELKRKLDEIRKQQDEKVNDAMQAMRQIAPLIQSESKFVALVMRQREVVRRLDRIRKMNPISDAADRQEAAELRNEEAAIREAMKVLLQEIEQQAEQLGDDPDYAELKESTLQFVQDVRDSEIDNELSAARESLGKLDGSEGYAHAEAALTEMEKFLKQCQSNGEKAGQCLKKKFQPGMSSPGSEKSLDQMLAQMGMKPGSGDGYSMRGNNGQNVGLFGNRPFAQQAGRGNGQDGRMAAARGDGSPIPSSQNGQAATSLELPQSAQTSASDVPLRYRRQAENYLRRLAEEGDL